MKNSLKTSKLYEQAIHRSGSVDKAHTEMLHTPKNRRERKPKPKREASHSSSRVIHFVKLRLSGLGDAKEPGRMVDSPLSRKAMVLSRIMEYPAR